MYFLHRVTALIEPAVALSAEDALAEAQQDLGEATPAEQVAILQGLIKKMQEVIDKVHIHEDAVSQVRQQLPIFLGHDTFSALSGTSQRFLVTAEVIYEAASSIRDELDAALISVEYAKVIETELKTRFFEYLGKALDKHPPVKLYLGDGGSLGAWPDKAGATF